MKKELKKKQQLRAGREGLPPVQPGLKPNELPPLLARVNGQIEVIFTHNMTLDNVT